MGFSWGEKISDSLLRRCEKGDDRAIEELSTMIHVPLLQKSIDLARDYDKGEDVAGQVFEKILKHFKKVPPPEPILSFWPWLSKVINYAWQDELRTPWSNVIVETDMQPVSDATDDCPSLFDLLPASQQSIPDEASAREVAGILRRAIAGLSERHRTVIFAYYIRGFDCKQIASQMKIAEGNLKRLLYDARHELKKRLQDYDLGR